MGTIGADVHGAHAGMGPRVLRHVDQFVGLVRGFQRGIRHGLGRADKRVDRAVRVGAGVDVEQLHVCDALDRIGNRVDDRAVPALREIRDAFHQPGHQCLRKRRSAYHY